MSQTLLQEGIALFQAGERVRAGEIFAEVIASEPMNETAWYYRAAAENDPVLRRQYLQRVLSINPSHARAQEVLARMDTSATLPPSVGGFSSEGAAPPPVSVPPRARTVRSLDMSVAPIPGEVSEGGFVLPVTIPDAPLRVSFASLFRDGFALIMRGVDVLQRKPGVYEDEIARATWWRVWLIMGFATVAGAVFRALAALVPGSGFNIISFILTLIVSAPLSLLVFFGAAYASHYWATQKGSTATLYQHAYTFALPFAPVQIFSAFVVFALSFISLSGISLGGLGIFTFVVSLYGYYIAGFGMDILHRFDNPNDKWITLVVFFVSSIIFGFILGLVVGVLGIGFGII